jgi:hypothetical protein
VEQGELNVDVARPVEEVLVEVQVSGLTASTLRTSWV